MHAPADAGGRNEMGILPLALGREKVTPRPFDDHAQLLAMRASGSPEGRSIPLASQSALALL